MFKKIDGLIDVGDTESIKTILSHNVRTTALIESLIKQGRLDDAKNFINSINENQTESKEWFVRKASGYLNYYENPKILIIAGWFGLLGHLLQKEGFSDITILDIDPTCEELGPNLYIGLKYITDDICNFDVSDYDIIICTACEHLTDETINNVIKNRKEGSLVALQSNDYFGVKGHINCKETLDDFKESLNMKIIKTSSRDIGPYTRYLVIGGL